MGKTTPGGRICAVCQEKKPSIHFPKDLFAKDGKSEMCFKCASSKTCSKCKKKKSPKSFTADKSKKDGLYTWCKECSAKAQKEYRKKRIDADVDTSARTFVDKNGTVKRYATRRCSDPYAALASEIIESAIHRARGRSIQYGDPIRGDTRKNAISDLRSNYFESIAGLCNVKGSVLRDVAREEERKMMKEVA